jgi:hypothetical protein
MTGQRRFGLLTLTLWCLNTTARADVVTEWNLAALDAIRAGILFRLGPFAVGSDDLPGVQRSYASFSEAALESGLSR